MNFKRPRLDRLASAGLCTALLGSLACAQAKQEKLEKQATFLRKIATELGFVSLAQEEVDRLKKEYKDSADFKHVLQLDIGISLIGAKGRGERETRRTLYKQALDQSDEFINKYRGDPVVLKTQLDKIDAAYEFGRFLADDIETALLENPERAKQLEEDAANLYRRGVDGCDEVMKQLKTTPGGEDRNEYLKCWLYKGILLREHARAVKKERPLLCNQSHSTLEEMVLKVGEESVIGQRGLFEMAQIEQVRGKTEDAARAFQESAEASFNAAMDANNGLKGAALEIVVQTMEEAYEKLTSTLFEMGKTEEVLKAAEDYRKKIKEIHAGEGHEDPRFGHMVYLTEARALAETGDPAKAAKALEIARNYNNLHPNDIVGLRAKTLLKDILANQLGAAKGKDLFEIAKGDHQNKRYDDAIRGYKRALAVMTPEEKTESVGGTPMGLDVWHQMGLAFAAQERYVEAILAMKKGLETYPPSAEDEGAGSDVANHAKAAHIKLQTLAKGEPAFAAFDGEVAELVKKFGGKGSEAKLNWEAGKTRMEEKRYLDAAEAYGKIPVESIYHELGRARQAAAYQQADMPDEARKTIEDYREWQKSSKDAKVDPKATNATVKQKNRQIANAECDFVEGYLLYLEAMGQAKWTGKKKDPTKLPTVLAKFSDFKQRYGTAAPILTERSLDTIARVQIELGKLEEAMATHATIRQVNEKSPRAPTLLSAIFSAYSKEVKAREKEYTAVSSRNDAKPEEVKAARDKLNASRRAALKCGQEYAETAQPPAYDSLFTAMSYAAEPDLKEGDAALKLGNQIIQLYGNDAKRKADVDRWVRLKIGEVLLEQKKFREAYDMLVEAEKLNEKNGPLKRNICRALGGWYYADARGKIIPIPGLDKQAEAYKKYWEEYRLWGLAKKAAPEYSLPWYQFHWEAYSYASRAAEKDSALAGPAKTLYNIAKANDNFDRLQNELGADGKALYAFFIAYPPK